MVARLPLVRFIIQPIFKLKMGFLFASHTRFIAVFLGICTLIFFVFPGFSQEITAQFDEHISQQGVASWYSETDPGILPTTANMEKFDDSQLTCALWDVPFNTLIKVKNLENGKYVVVRVNDRGPARRLVKNGRIIDLTRAAFARIASLDRGLIPVEITLLIQN